VVETFSFVPMDRHGCEPISVQVITGGRSL
jgi:hypothetical protein